MSNIGIVQHRQCKTSALTNISDGITSEVVLPLKSTHTPSVPLGIPVEHQLTHVHTTRLLYLPRVSCHKWHSHLKYPYHQPLWNILVDTSLVGRQPFRM